MTLLRRLRSLPSGLVFAGCMALASIAIGIIVLHGPGQRANAAPASLQRPALTVTLEAPQSVEWTSTIAADGVIEPWQELVIGAQTSGLPLAEVRVSVGDQVRRGDVLAVFDPALPGMEAAQLEAALAQAQAAARQAVAVRDRMLALAAGGAVSRQDVQNAEMQADTATAQVRLVQAQLAARRQQQRYATVRAPDDGIVSARAAMAGTVANAGLELFRIIRQGRLEWRGELTAAQLAQVRPGQQVTLSLPDGSAASARIRQSAPRLDGRTRLAIVYADVQTGSRARAGMFAGGRIALGTTRAMAVPAHSVVVRDGSSLLFVAARRGSEAIARALHVDVGRRQGGQVEILGSLPSDARVVGQGAAFLKDGDVVRVAAADSTPAGGAQ